MKKSSLILIVIVCAVATIEMAVIMPSALLAYRFSVLFISTITIAFILPLSRALRWIIIQAGLVDLYSSSPFGTYMITTVVLVIVVKFLQYNWFKQPTALSLSLISVLGLIIAQLLMIGIYRAAFALNWLAFNPLEEISLLTMLLGIIAECVAVSTIIRLFRLLPTFVLA